MKRSFRVSCPCAFVIALSLYALACPADAQTPQRAFRIPAGDMKSALDAYAAVTGISVDVSAALAARLRTRGVNGTYDDDTALRRLLEGSSLRVCARDADPNGIVIASEEGCVRRVQSTDADAASDIIVTATAVSHLASRTRTGTRMDADPLTLPISVSTVSEALLARQQSLTLADAAANVSGVTTGTDGSFNMRGFSAGVQRNGDLALDGQSSDLPNLAISRLEVVKGPAAIIAGVAASYGGVVNVITKLPQDTFNAELVGTSGSRQYYDTGIDVGGPLNSDKSVLVRLVATTQDTKRTVNGYDGASNDYVAPSITWRNPVFGTEITAQYEYQNVRRAPDLIVFTDRPELTNDLDAPRLGLVTDGVRTRIKRTTIQASQKIVAGWTLTARYAGERRRRSADTALSFVGTDAGLPFSEIISIESHGSTIVAADLFKFELRGRFETGPIRHNLLLAYDNQTTKQSGGNQFLSISSTDITTGVLTDRNDALGPIYGVPGPISESRLRPHETGLLALDQMQWGDLYVLTGYRRMVYTPNVDLADLGTFKKSLPSLGVLYRATPQLSVYASASKGFTPNLGQFGFDGSAVAPEDAKQFEAGVKALLFRKRVAATASVYRIDQANVAVNDPAQINPVCVGGSACFITIPGVRSTGAELELSGTVLRRLEIRANYAYADKKAPASDGISANLNGLVYARHTASLWTTYKFSPDDLGFWLGSGIQARSARNEDSEANVSNPGQVRVDLSGGFQARSWQAIVGVKNVANKRLYDVGSGYFNTGTLIQPREFYATLRFRFR